VEDIIGKDDKGKKYGRLCWMYLAESRHRWWALVNKVMTCMNLTFM
jgi:hypothetical protein